MEQHDLIIDDIIKDFYYEKPLHFTSSNNVNNKLLFCQEENKNFK